MKWLFILLLGLHARADILLVPAKDVSFADYSGACGRPGYLCTHEYFPALIRAAATPGFDRLMDQVDLDSLKFKITFPELLRQVLKKEMLSPAQLEQALALSRQMKLKAESEALLAFREILKLSSESPEAGAGRFIFAFKSKVPVRFLGSLKSNPLKIIFFNLQFDLVPVREFDSRARSLLRDSSTLNVRLSRTAWRPFIPAAPENSPPAERRPFTRDSLL